MSPSTITAEFAAANDSFAQLREPRLDPVVPSRHVTIITCMDVCSPYGFVWVHVLTTPVNSPELMSSDSSVSRKERRTSSETEEGARETNFMPVASQRALETKEIAIFHHTDCGFTHFKEPELRQKIKSAEGPAVAQYIDSVALMPFEDPAQSVVEDVQYLKSHPLILKETYVSGWVHDTESGKIRQVA